MRNNYFKQTEENINEKREKFVLADMQMAGEKYSTEHELYSSNGIEGAQKPWGQIQPSFVRYKSTEASEFYIEEIKTKYINQSNYLLKGNGRWRKTIPEDLRKEFEVFEFKSLSLSKKNSAYYEILLCRKDLILHCREGNYDSNVQWKVWSSTKIDISYIKSIILKVLKPVPRTKKEVGKINILIKEGSNLKLKPIEKSSELDLTNYTSDFDKVHEKVLENLKKTKGIILYYGAPGTGKTTYIKALPSIVKSKKFIFIPPAYVEILASPEFLPFMMEHKNSVLVIEDAESVLRSRKDGRNHAVSNLLNLADGILSELLDIQIICTLNCNINQVDEAVRRPGRLLLEYEFKKLNMDETISKLKILYPEKDIEIEEGLTIAEIYNYTASDIEKKISNRNERELIGFKR